MVAVPKIEDMTRGQLLELTKKHGLWSAADILRAVHDDLENQQDAAFEAYRQAGARAGERWDEARKLSGRKYHEAMLVHAKAEKARTTAWNRYQRLGKQVAAAWQAYEEAAFG